jgi:hypothetical protein
MSKFDHWFPAVQYQEGPLLAEHDSHEVFRDGPPLSQYQQEKWILNGALSKARSDLQTEVHKQDRYHAKAFDKKRQYVSEKTMQHNLKVLRETVKKAQQDLDVLEVRKLLHNW